MHEFVSDTLVPLGNEVLEHEVPEASGPGPVYLAQLLVQAVGVLKTSLHSGITPMSQQYAMEHPLRDLPLFRKHELGWALQERWMMDVSVWPW